VFCVLLDKYDCKLFGTQIWDTDAYFNHIAGLLEKCEGVIPHFWTKIAPNHTILAKLHHYKLFGQNPLFCTLKQKLHFFALFGKNCTSLKQNHTFFHFSLHFSRCSDIMPGMVSAVNLSLINASILIILYCMCNINLYNYCFFLVAYRSNFRLQCHRERARFITKSEEKQKCTNAKMILVSTKASQQIKLYSKYNCKKKTRIWVINKPLWTVH